MEPKDYWLATNERRSQHLYVAFCEFASAALDYCEGRRLLQEGRPQGSVRLNWAATALYYCLVHSARFLVFVPVGDFPTSHAMLPKCFDQNTAEEPRTNWLTGLLAREWVRPEDCYTRASFQKLSSFWSHHIEAGTVDRTLPWFSEVLVRSKQLRNENNYEALLIAHEYRHFEMTGDFALLAAAMDSAARTGLYVVAEWFRAYLVDGSGEQDPTWSINASGFVGVYLQSRILEPARKWYPRRVVQQLEEIIRPLASLNATIGSQWRSLEEHVDWAIFNPKRGLMTDFQQKVREFQRWLEHPTIRPVPASRHTAVEAAREIVTELEPTTVKERAKDKAKQHGERNAKLREERATLIARLNELRPDERLAAIAGDTVHPLNYYPPAFADVEDNALAQLDPVTVRLLVDRLANQRKGTWHRLYVRLRATSSATADSG